MVITLAALLTLGRRMHGKNKVTECINPLTYTDVPDLT